MKKNYIGEKEDSPITKEELLQRQYKKVARDFQIKKMRANVIRKQIVEAYEIIENIRFDYLSDTMFRDYFTRIKNNLEGALGDFLLDESYWKERIAKHRKMTPKEYDERLKTTPTMEKSEAK